MELSTALGIPVAVFFLLLAWSIVWTGWALWISARKGSKIWFIVLLVTNTLGILEILYIFFFSKRSKKTTSTPESEVVVEVEVGKEE